MLCGLGEERTKIRRKKTEKKGKKGKKLIAAESGLVGMKEYLKTYNLVKFFLPYLCGFGLRPLFMPNLWGGFRVLKQKSRNLLPRNLIQTYNLLLSNCCQNFMQPDQIVLDL